VSAADSTTQQSAAVREPILSPLDRNAEILFGLFMCLTFTGTLAAATAGHEEVRTMMFAAIGCNTAWGMVDGVMYVLRALVTRGRTLHLAREVRALANPARERGIVAAELSPLVRSAIGTDGVDRIRSEIHGLAEVARRPALGWGDVKAGLLVFALVFLSTFPVVLPFVLIDDVVRAKRVSAAVAIALLFVCGYTWGKHAGLRPGFVGVAMVVIGVAIEAAIIALGG
jgi:VIT1/CCC1 family predicted Fe2+/Mn2+ transporter